MLGNSMLAWPMLGSSGGAVVPASAESPFVSSNSVDAEFFNASADDEATSEGVEDELSRVFVD